MLNHLLDLAIGVVFGGIIGWLLAKKAAAPAAGALQPLADELRQQLAAREAVQARLQSDLAAAQSALAGAQATQQALEKSSHEQRAENERTLALAREAEAAAEQQLVEARTAFAQEKASHAAAAARLGEIEKSLVEFREAARQDETIAAILREQLVAAEKARSDLDAKVVFLDERLATQRSELEKTHEIFRKEFEAVSHRLLVENANHFKQQSSENLDKLLGPLRENLKDFRARLEETSRDTASQNAVLKDQISRIGTEAANLARALKGDAKVLGNWGEQRLDQLLEKSGLQLGVHYERQQAATDSETDQQRYLDVIVKLPEGKHLIIDSKVSLTNYEAHINAPDEAVRALHLGKHIESIRKHVKDLAAKRYQDLYGINAPDFVLMYIPLESAFFAAVAHEPDLFADALDRNVVLITNSTLLATLRTVAHVWRLADQQANALEIARRGGALYDKFCGFVGDLDDLGKSIGASQKSYDEAIKKLHQGRGNLVRQAEELKTLGVKASKSLPSQLLEKAHDGEVAPALLN
ncbi:MAG TPA: DNA recombination protein RmuC [Chthoniobacteraceae bacterium]|nr:DNA recombination protein RmuC [Chthoniobacteraceae bacterium]